MTVGLVDPFEQHGFVRLGELDGQLHGNCVLCDDPTHFYVSQDTGQWDCKKCGDSGNVKTFLQKFADRCKSETTREQYASLAKDRKGTVSMFRRVGWAWSPMDEWVIPIRNERGYADDIRRWKPGGGIQSTKGCKLCLYGLHKWKDRDTKPVVLCEGEWDAAFFQELARQLEKKVLVLGTPGAWTFKPKWTQYFARRDVWILYDNDEAGDRGASKVFNAIRSCANSVRCIHWPESRPDGWDIRDHVSAGLTNPRECWAGIERLLHDKPRHDTGSAAASGGNGRELVTPDFDVVDPVDRPTLTRVEQEFAKYLTWDSEMRAGLHLTLAVVVSEQIPGPPVWLWVQGASASGKTALLSSTQTSDRVVFRSSIHPKALVSGFNQGSDPSLLLDLHGKTAVFKDATEMLTQNIYAIHETMSVLRGAYDGHVSRSYGNNVKREYVGLHFSVLAGVTAALDAFSTASLGERFLRYRFRVPPATVEDRIRTAIAQTAREDEMERNTQELVRKFLAFQVGALPKVPRWVVDRVVSLAQLTSLMRTTVERNRNDEIVYRPDPEHGTRIAKQLVKLAIALAVVRGETRVSADTYSVVERVAIDTSNPWHVDILKRLHTGGGELTSAEIEIDTRIPLSTLRRRLDDMSVLRIVRCKGMSIAETAAYYRRVKRDPRGRKPASVVKIPKHVQTLLEKARLWQ